VTGDITGIRLEASPHVDRFSRLGAYTLLWTHNDRKRKALLGRTRPDARGIYWQRVGTSYSAIKPLGERLLLSWVGRPARKTTPQWDRLERAVQAALTDDLSRLPPGERPCSDGNPDPADGDTGACSMNGIPVTVVDAPGELSTPAVEAEILGVGSADRLRFPGKSPLVAKGQFLLVAYRVRNTSPYPIRYIQPRLRLGSRTVEENPEAAFLLPRSRPASLPSGATLEARAAFDVASPEEARDGAFVIPGDRDGRSDPSLQVAQGWIRLSGAREGLPRTGS
jgi:hypothetical protein